MKDITEMRIKDNEDLREIGMHIMQYIFSKSQENLVNPMPWGDEKYPSLRDPSAISDSGLLLQSGVPPYWQDDNTIAFRYDAVHAPYVEYGTPPHPVGAKHFIKWVNHKLGIHGEAAIKVAWAIAGKIKKEGMDPHPFIRPAVEAARREFRLIEIHTE